MKTSIEIKQFALCEAFDQQLVILTNPLFNEVDSILVATFNKRSQKMLITGLQIPIVVDDEDFFVDLLDIATMSKNNLKSISGRDLLEFRSDIKTGLNLLIDGF
jgi:hypothetical protein